MRSVFFTLILFLFTACSSTKNLPEEPLKIEELVKETPTEHQVVVATTNPPKSEIRSSLERYLYQLQSLNTENIIAMTYPKLFTATSQYLFRGSLYTMANSSNLKITSFNTKISKIGKIAPFSDGTFTNIAYISLIKVQFINPTLYNTELSLNTLHSILAKKYGQKNIYVDKKRREIHIKKQEKMLAIKEKGGEWKFLGDNPAYRNLYPYFLPQDILDRI